MIRRIARIMKNILLGVLLTITISSPVLAQKRVEPYQLKESSINRVQKTILLDLAHHDTSKDEGCSYGGYNEREIAENITLKVKDILESKGISVQLTRGKDDVISIAERIAMANSNNYDYYISIHVNSCEGENRGTGVEAWSNDAWSLSNKVLTELSNEFGYENRGIFQTDFYNKRINTKSTILEIGFINNSKDRYNLINHKDEYAECIAKGIYDQLLGEN